MRICLKLKCQRSVVCERPLEFLVQKTDNLDLVVLHSRHPNPPPAPNLCHLGHLGHLRHVNRLQYTTLLFANLARSHLTPVPSSPTVTLSFHYNLNAEIWGRPTMFPRPTAVRHDSPPFR